MRPISAMTARSRARLSVWENSSAFTIAPDTCAETRSAIAMCCRVYTPAACDRKDNNPVQCPSRTIGTARAEWNSAVAPT